MYMQNLRRAGVPASILLAALTLSGALATPAHATRPYATTEDAATLPPGAMRAELAFNNEDWGAIHANALDASISYSLYSNLDLEVELPYLVVGGTVPGGASAYADGIGDVWTKAKINFMKERAADPLTVSGQIGVKFPTGDRITGSGKADVRLAGLASKTFGEVSAHGNLFYTFVGGSVAGQQLNNVPGVSLGLETTVGTKVSGVLELDWEKARLPVGDNRTEFGLGMVTHVSDGLDLDMMLRKGVGSSIYPYGGSPDWALTFGMTYTTGG
ncbi:MAG: hypothetical protein OEW11_10935 [Nitrospirota bacterium]|nr:hypothetical protein [Nitrospirota bacterium]